MNAPKANEIDGQAIAERILGEVRLGVAKLRRDGLVPNLVAVQVGGSAGSEVYIRKQKERFAELGIQLTHLSLDQTTTVDALFSHIDALNANPTVTGILLTMPLPDEIPAAPVQERIDATKDVEGVNPTNLGRLIYDRHATGPCTALAVLEAIDSTGVDVEGKHVVVVGHSDIVGKPVGLCLLQEMATLTTCHIATRGLEEHTRNADILVVAVGKPGLITGDMVRDGVIVIDVGINRVPGRRGVVGDVDYDSVSPKASWITPVPGGVGPITVAMLARNTFVCANHLLQSQ